MRKRFYFTLLLLALLLLALPGFAVRAARAGFSLPRGQTRLALGS